MTPGFHFDNAGSRQNSQPRMRGMDINTANPTRQNASFFIDGIYMPGSTQTLDFSEFERVEVIADLPRTPVGKLSKKDLYDEEEKRAQA